MKTCKKPSPASARLKLWIWFELWNSIGIKGKEEVWVCVLTPHWCLSPLVMSQIGHFQFTMCQKKTKNYEVTPQYGWACNSTHIPAAQKFSLLTVRNSIFVYLVSRILPCLHLTYVKNFRDYQLVDQGPNSAEPRGPANTISKMFKLCLKTLVPKKTTNVCVAEMRLRLLF